MARGYILYRGPSQLDGRPIVAILTRVDDASANEKTGDMAQTFILSDVGLTPGAARKTGDDAAICGTCPMRPSNRTDKGQALCYVQMQAPTSVYRAFERGAYQDVSDNLQSLPSFDKAVRFGTYGDPAAVPVHVWRTLATRFRSFTGYTHQWRDVSPAYAAFCMASVDVARPDDVDAAHAMGYRTFRVTRAHDVRTDEILCPASKEAGQVTTCAQCRLCMGNTRRAKSIVIVDHGPARAWKAQPVA